MATTDELKKKDGSAVKLGALPPNPATGGITQLPGDTLPQAFANSPQQLMGTPAVAPVNNRIGNASPVVPDAAPRGFAPSVTAGALPFKSDAATMLRDTRAADQGITGVVGFPSAAPVAQPAQTGGATGTWAAPAVAPDAFADSRKVANEVKKDVSGAWDAGNYSGAMGRAARGYLATGVAGAVDAAGVAAGALRPVGNLASNLFTGQDMSSGASPAVTSPASAVPNPAAPATPGSPAAIAQSTASPASATATSPAGALPSPGQVNKTVQPNGVTSYSGADVSGDINLPGNRGGVISAQNNQAAENLARAGGQTRGFGPAGAIRGGGQVSSMDTSAGFAADRKQLTEIDAGKAAQEANMQAQADFTANKVLEGRALAGNRGALQIMNSNARNKTEQRGQDIQAGATKANYQLAQENQKLAAAKDGREATAAGFNSRSAGRIEALQAAYEAAKPADKAGIAEQLRVMTGKDKPAQWKAIALQGSTDSQGNKTEGVLAGVNEQTGEVRRLDQGGKPALPPGMVKQVGTSNGKPVYEDANGKQHF
ncbi:hypothetical protein [Rhodoferax ferrireducens]|uniref:hypothetical protein n=1 Tax=Rhodoferax ferrireducens TaxID=192843 RepID=UPI000E0D4E9B|nr:hypothetical protein [Rhodoferax ferrireducens]